MVNMSPNNSATTKLNKKAIENGICLRFNVKAAIEASILAGNTVDHSMDNDEPSI